MFKAEKFYESPCYSLQTFIYDPLFPHPKFFWFPYDFTNPLPFTPKSINNEHSLAWPKDTPFMLLPFTPNTPLHGQRTLPSSSFPSPPTLPCMAKNIGTKLNYASRLDNLYIHVLFLQTHKNYQVLYDIHYIKQAGICYNKKLLSSSQWQLMLVMLMDWMNAYIAWYAR